jgi:AraC-like DNA-binding protein
LSILDIQNETGISEAKISAIIKNKSGITFKQFLNKLRLTESKRLLLETDLQVSEVAYKVGYNNVSHFNRIFKEVENCTPNDFRKSTSR